jgi:predicted kinase
MNPSPAATWHLITGSTGAGKSTLAHKLVQRHNAVRFAIDEWMNTLFWQDCPQKNDLPWALERVARCEAQIEIVATQLAQAGIDSILDLGFTQRDQRLAWFARAQATGIPCKLHVLDVPAEERWQRVTERNQGASATYTFAVTREMFDAMEQMWQLPDEAEQALFGVLGS